MPRSDPPRIAVIGAGPIGVEAALYARTLGYPVTVFERGEVGEHMSRWGHIRLFSPFSMNHTPLGLAAIQKDYPKHELPSNTDLLTGSDHRDAYLMPLTLTTLLCDSIRMDTEVLHIGRANVLKSDPAHDPRRAASPFRLLVRQAKQESIEEADVVLDCSGTLGMHRWLGEGGIPAIGELAAAPHITYLPVDVLGARKEHYAGKSVVVVGGGYSAATTIASLAQVAEQNPATWIIWLNHGPRSTPLTRLFGDPLKSRDRLAALANGLANRGEGHVEYHSQTVIQSVESHGAERGIRITARCGSEELLWEVERLIANVGYVPDLSFCRELHVLEPVGGAGVVQPEPNYFLLGMKSYGRDAQFLLSRGFEQIRDVFARVAGKPKLDLYDGVYARTLRLAA